MTDRTVRLVGAHAMEGNTQALEWAPRGKSGWQAIVLFLLHEIDRRQSQCHLPRDQATGPFTALTRVTFYGMVLERSGWVKKLILFAFEMGN